MSGGYCSKQHRGAQFPHCIALRYFCREAGQNTFILVISKNFANLIASVKVWPGSRRYSRIWRSGQ